MALSERLLAAQRSRGGSTTPEQKAPDGPAPDGRRVRRITAPDPFAELKRVVHAQLVGTLGPTLYDVNMTQSELEQQVRAALQTAVAATDQPMSGSDRTRITQEIADDILGYGPLEPFLRDPTLTEVMVNSAEEIFVERDGKLTRVDAAFADESHLRRTIDKIVGKIGRRVDETSPMVDARLPDGSRVNAIIPPLALDGSKLTIRKFAADPYTVEDLISFDTLTRPAADLLEACVKGRLNILVSGGTGAGKTTTLNVLSSFIPPDERIVTIEDAAELRLHQDHVLRLESRPANIEGKGAVQIRDLVRNSLRMRPDRIVVGEIRDAAALDMLQAMNTGHDGSLSTVHANTPRDALVPRGDHGADGRHGPAGAGDPRAGLERDRPDHPAVAAQGRHPQAHRHQRGGRHGGRHHHAPGRLPLRLRRRVRRARTVAGPPAVDRAAAAVPRAAHRQQHPCRPGRVRDQRDQPMKPGAWPLRGRARSRGRVGRAGSHTLRAVLGAAAASGLLLLLCSPAQAADEVNIDHVEVADDGTVSVLLGVDHLPGGGAAPDLANLEVTLDGEPVDPRQKRSRPVTSSAPRCWPSTPARAWRGAPIKDAKAAALAFLDSAPPDVQVGLLTFSGTVARGHRPVHGPRRARRGHRRDSS